MSPIVWSAEGPVEQGFVGDSVTGGGVIHNFQLNFPTIPFHFSNLVDLSHKMVKITGVGARSATRRQLPLVSHIPEVVPSTHSLLEVAVEPTLGFVLIMRIPVVSIDLLLKLF